MPTLDAASADLPPDAGHRFAAYIAHELRTPIAFQRLLAEAALADPGADTRALCEEIIAACDQQRRLIDGLIDLTRSRGAAPRREPVDLALLARSVLDAHDPRDLVLTVALAPAPVSGDGILLERLCANLVSNAIRHNVAHGRIEVMTATEAGRAVLAVVNTGPVVASGELGRLFEPFEQGPGRRVGTDGPGLGLGLSIVRSIADAHEATLSAHVREGGGLAIEVSLPARRGGASLAPVA